MQDRKGIGVCTVSESTRPIQNLMAIPKACEKEPPKCMWMAATCGELPAIWRFHLKPSRCGWPKQQRHCPMRLFQRKSKKRNGWNLLLHWWQKNRIYMLTAVDRKTRCILGWAVVWTRTKEAIQDVVDHAPKAKLYYSDGFDAYQWLWYHFGKYEISKGKAATYSVEADNGRTPSLFGSPCSQITLFFSVPLRSWMCTTLICFCLQQQATS